MEWTGAEWNSILRKAENCEEWRKLVVRSTVVPQRSARPREVKVKVKVPVTHSTRPFIFGAISNNNNCIQRRNSRFFTISSLRREPSPTRTLKWPGRNRVQIACNTSSGYHVQHVVLRATWYEVTPQLLSLTELKSYLFELHFIGWTNTPMKKGRKPEYPEKTPDDELQNMPHTKARKFKPQARPEPVQQHWWQAGKADVLTVTPHVAPIGNWPLLHIRLGH